MSTRADTPTNRALVAKLMRQQADRSVMPGPTPEYLTQEQKLIVNSQGQGIGRNPEWIPLTRVELLRFAKLLEDHPTGRLPLTRQHDQQRFGLAITELNHTFGYLSEPSPEEKERRKIPIDPSDEDEYNTRPEERGDTVGNALFGVEWGAIASYPNMRRYERGHKKLPKSGVIYPVQVVRLHLRRDRRGFYHPVSRYTRVTAQQRAHPGYSGIPTFGKQALNLLNLMADPEKLRAAYSKASPSVKQEFDRVRAFLSMSDIVGDTGGR